MAVRTLPLLVLLALTARAAPAKDPKTDPKWVKSVHASIDRGVAWILARQGPTGKFPAFEDARGDVYELGMHALALLAVVKGGHPLDSPEVTKGYAALHSLVAANRSVLRTYEAGIALMAIDAKYFTVPPKKSGKAPRRKKVKIVPKDLAVAQELATFLQGKQTPQGGWRYPEGGLDLSNTQYATLGLWSAHRLGIEINKGVVKRMIELVLERQQPPGHKVPFILDPEVHRTKETGERRSGTSIDARGWRYMPEEIRTGPDGKSIKYTYPYSGSMTTAGIAVLAVGRDILGEGDAWLEGGGDRRVRRAMWEGLAWLQSNWDLKDNPGQPGNWPFYWLYGLERAARLAGVEYVGKYDWYLQGATRLMGDQREDGSWPLTQRMRPPGDQNVRWWSDQVDTAFAILFLSRSTPELKTPPPTITSSGD